MRHYVSEITISCPKCDADLHVTIAPPERSVGIMGAYIGSIEDDSWGVVMPSLEHAAYWVRPQEVGCPHAEMLLDDDRFYEEAMARLNECYEDEMEARYDRWRDRDLDRYYRDKETTP